MLGWSEPEKSDGGKMMKITRGETELATGEVNFSIVIQMVELLGHSSVLDCGWSLAGKVARDFIRRFRPKLALK